MNRENENESVYARALDVALKAGALLLESGAEIRRVEDTVVRIASHFDLNVKTTIYSLTSALFVSAETPDRSEAFSRVLQVPMKRMRLNHLIRLNQLSRDLTKGAYTLEEAEREIESIATEKDPPYLIRIVSAFLASFCFAYLFGGNWMEGLVAAFAGMLSFLFVSGPGVKISKLIANFAGGAIFALIALLIPLIFPALGLRSVYIMLGAMMPLVPGVSFMNSFRDFANGDYLSGVIRLLDAILIGTCLASGAAIVWKLVSFVGGLIG